MMTSCVAIFAVPSCLYQLRDDLSDDQFNPGRVSVNHPYVWPQRWLKHPRNSKKRYSTGAYEDGKAGALVPRLTYGGRIKTNVWWSHDVSCPGCCRSVD